MSKQDFKFSAAHFLIFDEHRAEKLHGHNYQVQVHISFSKVPEQNKGLDRGYLVDFNEFKKHIRSRLAEWDESTLLPANHPDMKFLKKGKSLEVNFRDRFYVFPQNEVILLPITNTSTEQLSRLLAVEFFREFRKFGVAKVRVYVEETRGQGASTTCR